MTMRLIDADALKEEIEFHPTSVSVCMTVAEAKGQTYFKNRCLEDIDNAPTIDAIPIDWLREKMRGYASALKSTELSAMVTVMSMWEKEQEGQDE
jgi:hypothetical protein